MQVQSHHTVRRLRRVAFLAPMCAAIIVGGSAPAAAVVTPGPLAPTATSKIAPLPAPPANILPLALPLILAHDAQVAREEQKAGDVRPRTFVPLTLSQTISPSAIALAALGVVTLAGGTAFAALARRRT